MKKLIFILLAFYTFINAQVNIDSQLNKTSQNAFVENNTTSDDSIDIRNLVAEQILAAKLKTKSEQKQINNPDSFSKVKITEVPYFKPKKSLIQLFLGLSFGAKLFIIISVFLLSFIAIRRIVLSIQKKENMHLKNKIKLLREEKVPSKLEDKKTKSRRELIHNLPVKKLSEKNITKKAKELRISKGELMLAARLKYLEYEKL